MTSTPADLTDLDALAAEEPFVRALARSLLFDDAQVDDVVQQTWLEALRHGLPGGVGRRGWLARVVRSRASNERRGASRRARREAEAARPEAVASPADLLARAEQRRQVVDAVAALSEPYRTAILLRYFEGEPPRAIARRLDVPLDTVNTRLRRGRAMLRERLDAEHGGDRRRWMLALVPICATRAGAGGGVMATLVAPLVWLGAMKTLLLLFSGVLLSLALMYWPREAPPSPPESIGSSTASVDAARVAPPAAAGEGRAGESAPARASVGGASSGPAPFDARQLAALTGVLHEPDGRPAAGRRCRLLSLDPLRCHPGEFEPDRIAEGAAFTAVDVTTDAAGVFRFERLPAGQAHALWLGHGGANATLRPLGFDLPAGRETDLGVVVLEPRASIAGRVVGADGAPVEGARVRAFDLPGALLGLAPVDRLAPGGALLCALPEAVGFAARPDGARALVAAVQRFLAVDVPTADADAEFAVLPFPAWLDASFASLPVPDAVTDAAGRFRIDGLIAGDHAVAVEAAGHARHLRARVGVRESDQRELGELRVDRGERLACRVVDAEGRAVAGAEVRVALRPRVGLTGVLFADPARTTGADGECAFDALPRGEFVVVFRRDAGSRWHTAGFESGERAELALPATRELRVTVRGVDGRPVPAPRFWLWHGPLLGEVTAAGLHRPLRVAFARADDGAFVARGIEPGVYTLAAAALGHALTQRLVEVPVDPTDAAEVELELDAGVDCEVEVVDAAGAPVPAAEVWVLADADAEAAFTTSILFRAGVYAAWDRLARGGARTDAEGRTGIAALPTGAATVLVRHRALGRTSVRFDPLGERVRVVLASPGTIVGRVLERTAAPGAGRVELELNPARSGDATLFPDAPQLVQVAADGSFRIDGVAPGDWQLAARARAAEPVRSIGGLVRQAAPIGTFRWHTDPPPKTVTVRAGAVTEVVLDLDPLAAAPDDGGATVSGTAVLDGVPARGAKLTVRSTDSHVTGLDNAFATTDERGQFVRGGVRAGEYELTLRLDRQRLWWTRAVRVAAVDSARVDFVATTAPLEVSVRTPDGRPAAGHIVQAIGAASAGGRVAGSATTDAGGRARLRLPLGVYQVRARGEAGHAVRDGVPAATGRVEIVLATDGMLRVRLDPPARDRVRSLILTGANRDTMWFFALPSGEPHLTIHDLAPGRYEAWLDCQDGQFFAEPRTIEIAERGLTEQTLAIGARRDG
jgi:RNA polymerase sigma-70 factor (ECF subfamily)